MADNWTQIMERGNALAFEEIISLSNGQNRKGTREIQYPVFVKKISVTDYVFEMLMGACK